MSVQKDIITALKALDEKKTKAYDTTATVVRVEGSTAWVHIPGGVDETPVELTTGAKVGETVRVRVSGGSAWLYGNNTSPATDDTVANIAQSTATKAKTTADNAYDLASSVEGIATTAVEKAETAEALAEGVDQHFWVDDVTNTGAYVSDLEHGEDKLPQAGAGYLRLTDDGTEIGQKAGAENGDDVIYQQSTKDKFAVYVDNVEANRVDTQGMTVYVDGVQKAHFGVDSAGDSEAVIGNDSEVHTTIKEGLFSIGDESEFVHIGYMSGDTVYGEQLNTTAYIDPSTTYSLSDNCKAVSNVCIDTTTLTNGTDYTLSGSEGAYTLNLIENDTVKELVYDSGSYILTSFGIRKIYPILISDFSGVFTAHSLTVNGEETTAYYVVTTERIPRVVLQFTPEEGDEIIFSYTALATASLLYDYTETESEEELSFTFGNRTDDAYGYQSLASGNNVSALGAQSQAFGSNTIASGDHQAVFGEYNRPVSTDLFQVGWGTEETRRNVFRITDTGKLVNDGYIVAGATDYDSNVGLYASTTGRRGGILATTEDNDNKLGLWDTANQNWVLQSDTDQNVIIPHPLQVSKTTALNGNVTVGKTGSTSNQTLTVGDSTATQRQELRVENSSHAGRMSVGNTGIFGLYSDTNDKWLCSMTKDGEATFNGNAKGITSPSSIFDVSSTDVEVTVSASSYKGGTVTVTKDGYYPLCIAGFSSSMAADAVYRCHTTARSSGSATVAYGLRNVTSSSSTTTLTIKVLWIKEG